MFSLFLSSLLKVSCSFKLRRRHYSYTRLLLAPICHTNHSLLSQLSYVRPISYDRSIKRRRKSRRRWNENDDDGITIRCRRRRLLPPSSFLPERGTFLMLVFMMAAVIHSFKKSLGANLISHLLLLTFSSCFSLIIFLTLFSATKYITLNMYVYITGS